MEPQTIFQEEKWFMGSVYMEISKPIYLNGKGMTPKTILKNVTRNLPDKQICSVGKLQQLRQCDPGARMGRSGAGQRT